jgi:hypothetical protein
MAGKVIFLYTKASRLALGPSQPPIHWVSGAFSVGVQWLGHEADCSPHLVPKLRMSEGIPSLPHMPSLHALRQFYLYLHNHNNTW